MKINLQSPVEEVQVPIIPLIDVIFCILTFFILAALQFTRQQAISVDVPRASTGTPIQTRQILIVSVDQEGKTYVEKDPVDREQLTGLLQKYRSANPNGQMVLYAAQTATYNDVVQVLDNMRQVGGDRVSLAIIPGQADQPAGSSPVPPSFPSAPGSTPAPSPIPVEPLYPYSSPIPVVPGNPSPIVPQAPGQFPSTPGQPLGGQGINPANPTSVPVAPLIPTPPATSAPQR